MGQSRPLFVYFHSFLVTISTQIEKSLDGVLGIRTRGRRMVGSDEYMELWQMSEGLAALCRIVYNLFSFIEPAPDQNRQRINDLQSVRYSIYNLNKSVNCPL